MISNAINLVAYENHFLLLLANARIGGICEN